MIVEHVFNIHDVNKPICFPSKIMKIWWKNVEKFSQSAKHENLLICGDFGAVYIIH